MKLVASIVACWPSWVHMISRVDDSELVRFCTTATWPARSSVAVMLSLNFTIVPGAVFGVTSLVFVDEVETGVDAAVDVGKSVRLSVREDLVLMGVAPKITFASITGDE